MRFNNIDVSIGLAYIDYMYTRIRFVVFWSCSFSHWLKFLSRVFNLSSPMVSNGYPSEYSGQY